VKFLIFIFSFIQKKKKNLLWTLVPTFVLMTECDCICCLVS